MIITVINATNTADRNVYILAALAGELSSGSGSVSTMQLGIKTSAFRNRVPRLHEAFRGRGIVELMFDNSETPAEIVAGYEQAAQALAPEVAAIPVVWHSGDWSDDTLRALYEHLRRSAGRYARQMRWRAEA